MLAAEGRPNLPELPSPASRRAAPAVCKKLPAKNPKNPPSTLADTPPNAIPSHPVSPSFPIRSNATPSTPPAMAVASVTRGSEGPSDVRRRNRVAGGRASHAIGVEGKGSAEAASSGRAPFVRWPQALANAWAPTSKASQPIAIDHLASAWLATARQTQHTATTMNMLRTENCHGDCARSRGSGPSAVAVGTAGRSRKRESSPGATAGARRATDTAADSAEGAADSIMAGTENKDAKRGLAAKQRGRLTAHEFIVPRASQPDGQNLEAAIICMARRAWVKYMPPGHVFQIDS